MVLLGIPALATGPILGANLACIPIGLALLTFDRESSDTFCFPADELELLLAGRMGLCRGELAIGAEVGVLMLCDTTVACVIWLMWLTE